MIVICQKNKKYRTGLVFEVMFSAHKEIACTKLAPPPRGRLVYVGY